MKGSNYYHLTVLHSDAFIFRFLRIQILYSRIAVVLWKSFRGFKRKNDAVHNLIAVAPNGKCKSTKKSLNELNLLGERSVKKNENRSTMVNINPVQVCANFQIRIHLNKLCKT